MTARADSLLKLGDRTFVFNYPTGDQSAIIRGPEKTKITIPGRLFEHFPERGWAFEEVALRFLLMKGDPVLVWLDGCFAAVHGIRRGFGSDSVEYKWWRKEIFFDTKFGEGRQHTPFWERIQRPAPKEKKGRK